MHESTEEFSKIFTGGKDELGKALEGYIYSRWPSLYIYHLRSFAPDPEVTLRYPEEAATPEADELARLAAERVIPTLLSRETSTYHGKVLRLDESRTLIELNRDVELTDLDTVIPYNSILHSRWHQSISSSSGVSMLPCWMPCMPVYFLPDEWQRRVSRTPCWQSNLAEVCSIAVPLDSIPANRMAGTQE